MNLILLGAPGAGKGTQAEVISQALSIPQISTGNMLREAVRTGTEYGVKAKAAMDSGALVSDDIVIDPEGTHCTGRLQEWLHSGRFSRSVPQAEALDEMGVKIDKVLEIFVPDETIKQRVSGRRVCEGCGATYHIQFKPSKVEGVCDKCGAKTIIRKDDQPETVLDRLAVYHKTTEPLKAYYEKQGKLETVIGQEEVADTTALVLKAVGVK